MAQFLSVAFEAALLAGVVSLQYLLTLLFRSPFKPRWLDIELVALVTAVMLTGGLAAATAALTAGLIETGMHYAYAFVAALIVWLLLSIVLWFPVSMGRRLRACDVGRSPFARLDKPPADNAAAGAM
ncbi:MAG: hypothetical protein ACFCUR_11190 [Rhodomicrobiaceae bacterium]